MASFDDWLAQLRAAEKGPVTLYAERGNALSVGIVLDAEYAGSTLAGKVRQYPDSAVLLVTFTCSSPTVADGQTSFTASLASGGGANSTGVLPAAPAGDGSVELAFDFELTPSGGSAEMLFGGTLVVLGSVTQ